jgi:hypothetical protein
VLAELASAALKPGGLGAGIAKRLALVLVAAALLWTLLLAGLCFAGWGLYQAFAVYLLTPWPALLVAVIFVGVATVILLRLGHKPEVSAATEVGQALVEQVTDIVRDNPWESVVAALTAGVVAGGTQDAGPMLIKELLKQVQPQAN